METLLGFNQYKATILNNGNLVVRDKYNRTVPHSTVIFLTDNEGVKRKVPSDNIIELIKNRDSYKSYSDKELYENIGAKIFKF